MGGVAIVVFSDLVDSTQLLARLGDDRMEEVRRAHVCDVRDVVDAAGGRVIKTLGDGAMASFDSALGALRAAAGIQAGVQRLDVAETGMELMARVGVAAGEPIAHEDDLHGMAVVIASRLCSAAAPGEVLVHDLVAALVASRDGVTLEGEREYELKGVPLPVRASRMCWRELTPAPPAAEPKQAPSAAKPALADGAALAPEGDGRPRDGVPLPRMLAAYAHEPLIGRDVEIGVLRECTAPRAGSRAVLVLGEPGIGKTRHAAAAAADAHAQGATVVFARCQSEATIAFEPWVRAIGELARAGDEAWRSALARAAGFELAVLVPELSPHAAAGERGGASEVVAAEGARYRLLHGIGAALAHAAGDAPLHVVLDDAHWCDAASAQALGHLLENSPTPRLLFVVTARERELGRRHPVTRVLADLRRTGDLSELRLEGLDDGGLAALVAARVGRAVTPRLAARLRERTAGNPFFAAELARDLDERGVLGEGEALDAAPVPDAVAGLVEERLARLDPVTERLLVAAAAIGPSVPVALAARAAGIGELDVAGAVGEAISERLVDDVPAAQPTIAFPHALIREALTASTDDAARARLHLATAQALEEQPDAEPAELARHYGLAVSVVGPERAIAAYEAASAAAAKGHDHEQAAAQLRRALALIPARDPRERARLLLELGEQELLAADLPRAREAFRAAGDAARTTNDADTLARAALGYAGGDIAFGWETGTDDIAVVKLLREALDVLGDRDPRLALRMILRLAYAMTFSDDEEALHGLARRARELGDRIGDTESQVLARFSEMVASAVRSRDPMSYIGRFAEEALELTRIAEGCGRDDLLFRVVEWSLVAHYVRGDIVECDRGVERAAEIATRLGSPRFTWEVDVNRALRFLDRGDRVRGEALLHSAGRTVRRLRPDIHMAVELTLRMFNSWLFDGETATLHTGYAAMDAVVPMGGISALHTIAAALDGDYGVVAQRMEHQLAGDLSSIRRPDFHLPTSLCFLAMAATLSGNCGAGKRLRALLEPLRPYLLTLGPAIYSGHVVEWHIGRLELLADRPEAAVSELRTAVERTDALGLAWLTGWSRVDLAVAYHRRGDSGDRERALATLAEGEALAEGFGMRGVQQQAALARAELEGREPPPRRSATEHTRPMRALTARTGRRALAAMVRDQDDETLERRFREPRRQRGLLRAMARGFQPARAGGFRGVIAFELEPYAIEAPPEAPWRWAIEVDSAAAHARLLEPAPLEAAMTVYFGLADWVRVIAGVRSAVTVVAAGRGSVEGDIILAARLEAMFGTG
jgi:class 3 adenylate cyclase/tetratricopeptide (TPR) repeat protein